MLTYYFDEKPNIEYVNIENPKSQQVVLKYKDFLCSINTGESQNINWDEILEIIFEDGRITVSLPPALLKSASAQVNVYNNNKNHEEVIHIPNWSWSFKRQAELAINDILNDQPSLIDAKNSMQDLEFIEDIWKAGLQHYNDSALCYS